MQNTKIGARLRIDMETTKRENYGAPSDFEPSISLNFDELVLTRADALKALTAFFDEYDKMP